MIDETEQTYRKGCCKSGGSREAQSCDGVMTCHTASAIYGKSSSPQKARELGVW
jgi:hypothetical protein